MDELDRESIKAGFRKEGWLVSQALTVWRTDETGEERNVIIDGEQRWTCALDVGLLQGPAVYLDGITEAEARALTVKLYTRRGSWTDEALAVALHPIDLDLADALDLGLDEDHLASLLDIEPEKPPAPEKPPPGEGVAAKKICAIVVECTDETDQKQKLGSLMDMGWPCRALI